MMSLQPAADHRGQPALKKTLPQAGKPVGLGQAGQGIDQDVRPDLAGPRGTAVVGRRRWLKVENLRILQTRQKLLGACGRGGPGPVGQTNDLLQGKTSET